MEERNAATARRGAIRVIGATGLAMLGAVGLGNATDAKKTRKKTKKGSRGSGFVTRLVNGEFSDPLPLEPNAVVESFADCGSAGR